MPPDGNRRQLAGGHCQYLEGQEELVLYGSDLGAGGCGYLDVGAFLRLSRPGHPTVRVLDMGGDPLY